MEKREFLKTLAIGGLGGAAAGALGSSPATTDATRLEKFIKRFEEIQRTRTFRAGWAPYTIFFSKDDNGQLGGVFYDLTMKIAQMLDWQVEWIAASTYGTIGQDLDTMRYDVYCGGIWPSPTRAILMSFSDSAFFSGLEVYVRPDLAARAPQVEDLNSSTYRMAMMDGEMTSFLHKADFDKAAAVSLPQTAQVSELLVNVATGKADFTVIERITAAEYLAANPGKVVKLPNSKPLRAFPNTFAVARDSLPMLNIFQVALQELLNSGYVEQLLTRYETVPDSLYRVVSTFQVPDEQ
ncbi:MAG: substrate-binding periplasmic protein [Bdellovibrionales bacterium]